MRKISASLIGSLAAGAALLVLLVVLAPASARAQEEGDDPANAILVDMAFGTEVDRETRTLEGEAEEFPAGTERVFCLTRIRNAEPPFAVTHAWFHEGKHMARVELNVGSGDWRTYSSKRLLTTWTGAWEVKVLDGAGKVLASREFTIK
jgi:hypothetical protein